MSVSLTEGTPSVASRRRIFPRLQIREKLLIAFVGLSVLPVLFVSLYGLYVNIRSTERIALENVRHDLSMTRGRASNFLANVEGDVRVLLNSTATQEYIRAAEHGTPADRDARLNALGLDLLAFARTKRLYYQIHVLNMDREEILRIESPDILDSVPHYLVAPPALLSSTGQSYYFLLTRRLKQGEIAFSPSELVYRGSQRLPVLSFATPLIGASGQVGLLVANVFAGTLFNEVDAQRNPELNGKTVLVGSDGHYLYNSDERADWNRLIAAREEDNLQRDYPAPVAAAILSGQQGIITEGGDAIIAYAPLFPDRAIAPGEEADSRSATALFVFEEVPRASVTREARSSVMPFVGFLALFFFSALVLGLLATRQFTRPLSTLRRGAEVISGGNYDHLLQIDTGDEIEALARQFNTMALSLLDHEREIQHHRSTLEETVDARTRELVMEKGKLQAILDNVPSAFVVLDRNNRIQTASAAFTSITGLSLDAVIGNDSRAVFRSNGLCQLSDDIDGPPPSKMESHVDRFMDRSGVEQFLEHTTIPMIDRGEHAAILEILTNITGRKRLEEHLIQSEKLMATGEMAAIIAHGFRNSLTSIKMILQLQEESPSLPRGSRKPLRVALESIERMEGVVHELLNFARPAPLVFELADLNGLLLDGLVLLTPRLARDRIVVSKDLHEGIPPLKLDAVHVREAIVNLLLNAAQAIESEPACQGAGRISISTRRVILSRTVRDYPSPPMSHGDHPSPGTNGREEIVLKRGRGCAVLTIADNGSGLDRSTMLRMFDPFFTTKTNGTGLGLPMVKRTINAHGGVLAVKSAKGRGASFEIILPLHADLP